MKSGIKKLFRVKYIAPALALVAAVGIYRLVRPRPPAYQFFTVKRSDIVQTVSVTGNTKPVDALDLSFQRGGRITGVYADVGQKVSAGQVLLEEDDADLKAQLASAEANTASQQAKLQELQNGTRPENIQIDETNVQKAQTSLANDYAGVLGTLNDSYIKSENAVLQQIDQIISTANGTAPQLTFAVNSSQVKSDVESGWPNAMAELSRWKAEVAALSPASPPASFETALQTGETHAAAILNYLSRVMDAVSGNVGLVQSTADSYKTNVTTAKTNVNTGLTAMSAKLQAIASDKVGVQQAENQLALDEAGSTPQDIQAQQAVVNQAAASADAIAAQIEQLTVRSPIAGTVSRQDGKLGEVVAANVALVSVISEGNLEIDANVPEVDIGKVQLKDAVNVTLDAFPGETFRGTVAHIDPAETVVDGVVNYQIKVFLDRADARVKSGLTANLAVETGRKTGVFIVPSLAVIDNDSGTFVRELKNGNVVDVPVRTGVRSSDGSVEILSGLSEGEQVINVGLKQ